MRGAPCLYVRVGPPGAGGAGLADVTSQVDESTRVLSLRFEDDEQKPAKLTLTIENQDLVHLDLPLWRNGNVVEFQFGYVGNMSPPRTAVIQSVKGFTTLTVEAQGSDTLMNRRTREDRVFENMKRSDAVREVLREYGYTDDQLRIEDTKVVHPQITQGPATDYAFIKQLAWREGFEFFIDFDGVHFHKRELGQRPIKAYRWFTEQKKGELLSVSIEDDLSGPQKKVGAIVVRGRDPMTKESFEVRADNDSVQRKTLMPVMSVLAVSAGTQAGGNAAQLALLGAVGSEVTMVSNEVTRALAERQAAAHFEKVQMRATKLTLSVLGEPNLIAKSVIDVQGIGQTYSGLYYVRTATHEVQPGAEVYRCTAKVSSDGRAQAGAGLPAGGGRGARFDLLEATLDAAKWAVDSAGLIANGTQNPGAPSGADLEAEARAMWAETEAQAGAEGARLLDTFGGFAAEAGANLTKTLLSDRRGRTGR